MRFLLVFSLVLLCACGSSSGVGLPSDIPTNSTPVVSRIDPTSGKAGDSITIYGFGFSTSITNNIIIMGNAAVPADSYNLVEPPVADEIEYLTATVPEDAEAGENSVEVLVYDNVSNADITFTVTP